MRFTDRLRDALLGHGEPDSRTRDWNDGYRAYHDDTSIDTVSPNKGDLEHFWDQYRTCSLVRIPIRMYAEDITEPGYRVEADADRVVEKLEGWLKESAIVAGEGHHDFNEVLFNTVVQKEVRGTTLVELVPKHEAPDEMWGFRLINVSTVNGYTYENQAVLIRPNDAEHEDIHLTPTDEAAAYGQWDDNALAGPFTDKDVIYLSQNDVLKLTQDGDTSDIFGTSTVEPVSDEIDELRKLLTATSEAIHSKGFPHWVFKLGEPQGDVENPRAGIWPDDAMQSYRDEHKKGNWSVGQKDFVPGDIDIETISSDVPEIDELVDWYVEQIISAMPVPKYKVGHADSVNRDITKTQQEQYERKVQAERRSLEEAFRPALVRKAKELGFGDELAESVELKIEEPREENPLARDEFDAGEFREFAQGVQALAPGGQADQVISSDEVREMLGFDTDEDNVPDEPLEEDDEDVQAQFSELYGEPLVHDEEPADDADSALSSEATASASSDTVPADD